LQVYSRQNVMPAPRSVVAILYSKRFAAVVVVTTHSILVADAQTGLWTQSISCAGKCLGIDNRSHQRRDPSLPCASGEFKSSRGSGLQGEFRTSTTYQTM
jgi:hypothetical protein